MGEYGDADPATQLGKDLKRLRQQGWQIDNVAGKGEPAVYRMIAGDNRLRLKLTPGQLAALQRAVILSRPEESPSTRAWTPRSSPTTAGTR